ncbi:MAG: phage tail tube protein, partial [Aurantimicrobium sp.]|uniref:phage tail tube protein n=1 Tax=Aurantimicrobium sp. TaxID=1930784 RepID=UPI002FC9313E
MLTSGVLRSVIYGPETAFGQQALASSGKRIRRVSAEINLTRETFESAEISSTAQTTDMRSGTDAVEGTLQGELSPLAYSDFFEAALRGTWSTPPTAVADVSITNSGSNKITRTTGSFITDGFKIGDTVMLEGFTATSVNGRALTVTAVSALELTVADTLVTEASGATKKVKLAGKKLMIPLDPASRTDKSFTFESYIQNLTISEVALGCKISEFELSIQPNAMATVSFGILGKTMTQSTGAQYFTSPAAAPTGS